MYLPARNRMISNGKLFTPSIAVLGFHMKRLAHQSGQLSQLAHQFGGVMVTISAEILNSLISLPVLAAQLLDVAQQRTVLTRSAPQPSHTEEFLSFRLG